jgi:polysaccharide export outer membrane protein
MPLNKALLALTVLCLMTAAPVAAQQVDSLAAAREQFSPAQQRILDRLRQSGLSREQMRQRLRQSGYDPNLADRYYDELNAPRDSAGNRMASSITRPLPQPSGSLVSALQRIGVLQPTDSVAEVMRPRPDTLRTRVQPRRPETEEPQVFGRELFAATTQFDPIMAGPVDPEYRLGPGDQLTLIVTGDVELAYELQVTREGYVVVPDVGQVIVNGLTLEQAKARMNDRLARVYSGVQVGSTQADITVGRLRSKLVYVVGEAEVPGAYPVNGSATVFSALYRAGGPALNGSFRNIEVRRGNRVIQQVDVYDYLLRGDKSGDVTLEQGDVVFIPVVGPQVTITGSVRRPAIFELKPGEDLATVVGFAGGVHADAAIDRIQIDRILPISERQPGRERVLVDVNPADLARRANVQMQNGDHIRIFRIPAVRRNRVAVEGDVQRPGEYEYRVGMTALDLINNAQGLLPSAYTRAAHVVRLNLADSSTSIVRVVLDDPASADYAGKVPLHDFDRLSIFGRAALANPRKVEIFGYVKNEGTFNFSDGMTIQDLVLLAGGFQEGAAEALAEVARRTSGIDTVAEIHKVPLDMRLSSASDTKGSSEIQPFELREGDQVFIRKLPGYAPLSTVEVAGEVVYPGAYTVKSRQERVTEIVRRAGGLTEEAYARGLRVVRDGKQLGVDFPKALKNPGRADDIVVQAGDRLEIPRLDPTVLVTGAVAFETRVRYERGLSLEDYLSRAGGVTDEGNAGKASVRYPNGELRTASRTLLIKRTPRVEPGSTITVPVKSGQEGINWDQFFSKMLTIATTFATVVVAINATK